MTTDWERMYHEAEAEGDAVRAAVERLHTKRVFDGDGYGWAICVEDRQAWPCATIAALIALAIGGEDRDDTAPIGPEGDGS